MNIILRRECLTVLNLACTKIWTMDDGRWTMTEKFGLSKEKSPRITPSQIEARLTSARSSKRPCNKRPH